MAIILSLAGGVVKCIVAITEPVKSIGRKKMTANEMCAPVEPPADDGAEQYYWGGITLLVLVGVIALLGASLLM